MFVVCCVGNGLCDGLNICPEESCYVRACVRARARACVCVIYKPQKLGGLGPILAVALEKTKIRRPRPYFSCSARESKN